MTLGTGREPDRCSAPYRVRFDEAAPDGRLRTSALLRYAQDLAWFHSARQGFDRSWYGARGLAWLARAAEVAVLEPMRVGDELVGTTRVVGWRRVWARRRTDFTDPSGTVVAWTHVDWVLLDGRGGPTRIPIEFDAAFGAPGADFPLGRVDLGAAPDHATVEAFVVRPQELDPMDHVNNAVYADWLDERIAAVGDRGAASIRAVPRVVRLEYARAAGPGMRVTATTWPDADGHGWSSRFTDPDGADLLRGHLDPGVPPAGFDRLG